MILNVHIIPATPVKVDKLDLVGTGSLAIVSRQRCIPQHVAWSTPLLLKLLIRIFWGGPLRAATKSITTICIGPKDNPTSGAFLGGCELTSPRVVSGHELDANVGRVNFSLNLRLKGYTTCILFHVIQSGRSYRSRRMKIEARMGAERIKGCDFGS
ncbi:hypothetical protein BDZ97DRAFT_1821888 [Flammula alnicola]|nr:hypothetical protein BDZ97DRAFT_1821888 [Flammula alnicola]